MKKIIVLFTVFVAATLLLSSCSRICNFSLTKRHYRGGYYVDYGSRQTASNAGYAKISEKTENETVSKIAAHTLQGVSVSHIAVISRKASSYIAVSSVAKNKGQKNVRNAIPYAGVTNHKHTTEAINSSSTGSFAFAPQSTGYMNATEHSSGGSDVPDVVIILCAIFIPPLGVALKFGIDSRFWIDLILTLLFFIPGMIYALILVLS